MFQKLAFLLLFFSFYGLLSAYGQTAKPSPPDDDVIRVDTQLVNVPIAVVDAKGSPIRTLKATNFTVFEDGKRQEIVDFSTSSEPFEVALLLDTSGSARADLQLIQRAALDFVSNLRPGDRVAVLAYSTERVQGKGTALSEILSPLTGDRVALRSAIQNAKTSNGTPFYDSLEQVTQRIFANRPSVEFKGRRALVALTDGVDSTSGADFKSVREALDELDIIVYFVRIDTRDSFEQDLLGDCESATRFSGAQIRRYYRSIQATGNMEKAVSFCDLGDFERLAVSKRLYEIADREMGQLAKDSGGKVFEADDLVDARNAFKSVANDIGTKYTVGYYPTNEKRDGKYRKIKVELTGVPKGATIRAREGYTAPAN